MSAGQLVFTPPGEGKVMRVLGQNYILKVSGAETGGAFSVIEMTVAPEASAPLHIHSREEESFYILEGTMEFQCGERTVSAPKGTTVMLPRNVAHGFRNPGPGSATALLTITPAGFEKFFAEISELPDGQSANPEKLAAMGWKYGLEFPPPPTAH